MVENLCISSPEDRPLFQILSIQKKVKRDLKKWASSKPEPKKEIEMLRKLCANLQKELEKSDDQGIATQFQNAKVHLERALEKEFIDARQKAKCDWLLMGDEATAFFYAKMSNKRFNNKLTKIDVDGKENDGSDFANSAILYYQKLFNKEFQDAFPEIICKNIISDFGANYLNSDFTLDEIKMAIWSIKDNSSPGLDGFNSKFYKFHWNRLKDLILLALNDVFKTGDFLKEWNHTFLHLIPKKQHATNIQDYRPIACCNTLYKVLTKLLCQRLSLCMNQLISENQTAFIKDRHIADGILLAHELVRGLGRKDNGNMCIKLT